MSGDQDTTLVEEMQESNTPSAPTPEALSAAPTPRVDSLATLRSEMSNFQADMLQRFDQFMEMVRDKSQPSSRIIKMSDLDIETVEAGPAPAQLVNTPMQPIS